MIYKTVQVTPNGDTWLVAFKKNPLERKIEKTKPHSLGFYHYPETMNDQEALGVLLRCMISRHEEEIERLNKSLEALKSLL